MEGFKEIRTKKSQGILMIFDRVIFRGSLRSFHYNLAFEQFLRRQGVLLKGYSEYVPKMSSRVKEHALKISSEAGRPYAYIRSPSQSKEEFAKKMAERDGIENGLGCVLAAVEPCKSFAVRGNGSTKRKEVVYEHRKCNPYYFYCIDKEFGWMHVRLQSWFPFGIQIYVNVHAYVARQLSAAGIGYQEYDNSFIQIDDFEVAQKNL